MALTVDQLNIQITADSQKATRALTSLIKKLEQLKATMSGSAVSNITIANSFNKTTNSVNKTDAATKKYDNTLKRTSKSSKGFLSSLTLTIVKWRTLFGVFNSAANIMGSWFKESNDYIETLNLFNVTMGDGAAEAQKYAESVQKLVGIDIAEWMNFQGTFKQLTSGFGVAEEHANEMSKGLTQLSYDMASFFNTDTETAFDKLSSAMSGQVKGLREFGIDTTVATLQEYALSQGIEKSVSKMTQAEKSLLRYNYIMEQSTKIQGDMARTIVTPANAMRILNAQLTQMKRALGNIISVLVAKFIPYIQAMVSIITDAANALAKFFGFELPKIDYSGLGSGFSNEMEEGKEALNGANGAAKKLKKQLMGFDELNILSNPDTSGSGGSETDNAPIKIKPIESYDFLKNLDTSKVEEIKKKMKKILEVAELIGIAIVGWKLGSFISSLITANTKATTLQGSLALLGKKIAITVGVTLAITGIALETKGIISALKTELNKVNFAEILGGGALGTGGISLAAAGVGSLFGKGLIGALWGAAIGGITTGIPMFLTGIYDALMNGLNWLNSLLIPAGSTMAGAGLGMILGPLVGAVAGPIGALFGAIIGFAVGFLTDLGILVYQKWDEIWAWADQNIVQPMKTFFQPLTDACSDAWTWLEENLFTPLGEAFTEIAGHANEKFTEIKDGVVEAFSVIKEKVVEITEKIEEIFTALKGAFDEYVWNPIKEKVSAFYVENIEPIVNSVREMAETIWTFLKEKIFDKAAEKIDFLIEKFQNFGTDVVDFISEAFKTVINAVLFSIEEGVNGFIRLLNKAIGIINLIPDVEITKIKEFSIPRLADGGFVGEGQMFIAREAGPELVGSIGRKTAVANNDQIVSGIEAGVYRAMVAANSGNGGGSQTIRIINEIDGDIVGEKVIQYHNGKVMQTGASPLLV